MLAVDDDALFIGGNIVRISAVVGIIFEKMRKGLGIGEIVDGDDFGVVAIEGNLKALRPMRPKPLIAILTILLVSPNHLLDGTYAYYIIWAVI